jgi:diguanylate cyclase (GGDEF)-like protein
MTLLADKRKVAKTIADLEKENELLWKWVKDLEKELEETRIDKKTGAIRIEHFNEEIQKIYTFAKLLNKGVAVFLVDIDDFKKMQDERSYLWGDEVLAQVVAKLQNTLRLSDLIFRFGGDEFLIIAPFATEVEANAKRDDLEKLVSGLEVVRDQYQGRVNITAGVSFAIDNLCNKLFDRANDDLKQRKLSKKVGR